MDSMLSQEEINALLNGVEEPNQIGDSTVTQSLTDAEKDAIGEISNISMGTAATTMSTLVNNKVVITTPVVSYATMADLSLKYDRPCVFISLSYTEGLDGNNVLILKESDVKVITDLMMGGDGTNTNGDLTDIHLSAIGEAMNQMMGSAATSISSMLEKKVDISPPKATLIDLNENVNEDTLSDFLKGEFVVVAFRMEIGDLVDSQIMQLYPFSFARDLYQKFSGGEAPPIPESVPTPSPQPVQAQPQPQPQPQAVPVQPQPQMMQMPDANQMQGIPMGYMPDVNVQPAQFQAFNPAINPLLQKENIDLIMDVPLEVTVELGRTNKSIKEILEFSKGTIVELNKLAGEPVDVLVNGKLIARGEVVVIEESFGIRITDILKQQQWTN